jgi:single-strand DNA-binding protein
MNRITLYGRIGADPETKQVSGTTLTKLSLATTDKWTDKSGEKQEKTQWHRLTCWGKTAEIAEKYVKKGDPLLIEGSVEYSSSGDGDDKRYYTEIKVERLHLMPKGEKSEQGKAQPSVSNEMPSNIDTDDDLPF